MEQTNALIKILLDKSINDADRDDAAIDLGFFTDDESVEFSLLIVANDQETHEMIRASCGESLAQIWLAQKQVSFEKIGLLNGVALEEALALIERGSNRG